MIVTKFVLLMHLRKELLKSHFGCFCPPESCLIGYLLSLGKCSRAPQHLERDGLHLATVTGLLSIAVTAAFPLILL